MAAISTDDGARIYDKDWGTGQSSARSVPRPSGPQRPSGNRR
jgi:hypothetical protein